MKSDQTRAASALTVLGFDRTDEAGVDDESGGRTIADGQIVIDLDRWTDLAVTTLAGEGVVGGQLDLIFVGPDEMAELNEEHMGHPGPTDVLSFPLDAPDLTATGSAEPGLDFSMLEQGSDAHGDHQPGPVHLGDIIICPQVAVRQAPDHCGTIEAELALLIIHGVLHILGHDHGEPEQTAVMRARERHYLAQLDYGHPEFP